MGKPVKSAGAIQRTFKSGAAAPKVGSPNPTRAPKGSVAPVKSNLNPKIR